MSLLQQYSAHSYSLFILFNDILFRNRTKQPNPNNLPEVNHIDEDKNNNRWDNLEWCDHKTNCNHGTRIARCAAGNSKPVRCIETGVIYSSATEASKQLGIDQGWICNCINKKNRCKSTHGLHWEYVKEGR